MPKAKKKKPIPHDQVSSLGGKATLKKYGSKHFSDIQKKRWDKVRKAKKEAEKLAK